MTSTKVDRIWAPAMIFAWLSLLVLPTLAATKCPSLADVQAELGPQLSCKNCITGAADGPPRWSEYGAPQPRFVVDVGSDRDVSSTVKYCNKRKVAFVTQNGGNGWANTFHLGDCGLVINIEALQSLKFNAAKTEAVVGGGVRIQELTEAAYNNGTRFANPTCNCLGYLGSTLGGGVNRASGLYGWAVDSIMGANVVLASGEMVTASASKNADLFWALKGAAPNFGIITSATVKTYPVAKAENYAWQGPLAYADNQLEAVVSAINNLKLKPKMQVDLIIGTSGAPDYKPTITVIPFYLGPAEEAKVAFKSILDIGPISNGVVITPYTDWGAFSDGFCTKGDRKPAYGVSTNKLPPKTWRAVFEEFKKFVATYGAAVGNSAILAEDYNVEKAIEIGGSTSSFPFRTIPYHTVVIPWYEDKSFDKTAEAFGSRVRKLLYETDEVAKDSTYINFAHGDEPLPVIYGSSLSRLQSLKKRYDPQNRFNQWFPLA